MEERIVIVVLTQGFVYIGRHIPKMPHDTSYSGLKDAACVRVWGTSRAEQIAGLGYIAQKGPTDKTRLDPTPGGIEYLRMPQEVFLVPCNHAAWDSILTELQQKLRDDA